MQGNPASGAYYSEQALFVTANNNLITFQYIFLIVIWETSRPCAVSVADVRQINSDSFTMDKIGQYFWLLFWPPHSNEVYCRLRRLPWMSDKLCMHWKQSLKGIRAKTLLSACPIPLQQFCCLAFEYIVAGTSLWSYHLHRGRNSAICWQQTNCSCHRIIAITFFAHKIIFAL